MLTEQERQVYPLATEDKQAIPLEVIRPSGVMFVQVASSGVTDITIPAGWELAYIHSTASVYLEVGAVTLPAEPVSGTVYANAVFIPGNALVSVALESGVARFIPGDDGISAKVRISCIQKWANIGLRRQLNRV